MTATKTFEDFDIRIPYGTQRSDTGEIACLCPKCSHLRRAEHRNHRCLSVNLDTGLWHCQHPDCGWSGGLAFGEQGASKMSGGDVPYGAPLKRREWAKPTPVEEPRLGEKALAWFLSRGITADVLDNFGVYAVASQYFPEISREAPALCFPYRVDGDLVNVKYRCATEKTFCMTKGARKVFFNLDRCKGQETVVIVEGEIDALSVYAAGTPAVLSVPNGANSLTPDVRESGEAIFEAAKKVVIAVDNDDAGRKLEAELSRSIGLEKCFRVKWPTGCKDANDVLVRHGKEMILRCIDEAIPYPLDGVIKIRDLMDAFLDLYDNGMQGGVSTGWETLDKYYRPAPGRLTIVTGDSGEGKSEFCDNLFINLVEAHNWRFAIFSPENAPLQRHVAKLVQKWRREPFGDGPWPRMKRESAEASALILDEYFTFINPETPTVDAVLERAKQLVYREGIRGIMLDPWNQFAHERPRHMMETEYISQSLTRIQNFARRHDVHVWIVVHPTKRPPIIDPTSGESKRPMATPHDLAGSMAWFTKADAIFAVKRDKVDWRVPVQVQVQKIRFREDGREGMCFFTYDSVTTRYVDVPQDDEHDDL